jgi:inosine-uridine nucleoside N-ribohydrolase
LGIVLAAKWVYAFGTKTLIPESLDRFFLALVCALFLGVRALNATAPSDGRIPIVLDTDVGTDIDDAFAIALIVKSPELELLGVTTVAGDTRARARLAAKLLWTAGGKWRDVPVFAGDPGPAQQIDQAKWAEGFTSPSLHLDGAVPFLRSLIHSRPGEITIVGIGELTNVAALLRSDPSIKGDIRQIALMGGSVARGYDPGSAPQPEWNISSNIPAAKAVFDSGIPLIVAPLDVTMMLKLDATGRQRVFGQSTPMSGALEALYRLWGKETPTLFDPMAVAMLVNRGICRSEHCALAVDPRGMTVVVPGRAANAVAGLEADPAAFFAFYLGRVAP